MAIGGTTAAAGAFTTLAASGAVTLSGGTANGVTYLNGGKQVTSGTAFSFNGTTVGINTAVGNSTSLSITGDYTPNNVATFIGVQRLGGAVAGAWSYNDAQGAIQFGTTTNHSLIFLQNNSEAMRLTSSSLYTASGINVGVGLSNPTAKLDVYQSYVSDATNQQRFRDGTGSSLNFGGYDNANKWIQAQDSTGIAGYYNISLNPLGGNVGIGKPNPTYKLDVAGTIQATGTGYSSATSPTLFLNNSTATTGRNFAFNSYNAGGFQIADQTAGGATRLEITASGNTLFYGSVGLGTNNPVSNGPTTSGLLHINTADVGGWAITHFTNGSTGAGASNGAIVGNIGIDTYLFNYAAGTIVFGTSGGQKAVIDSAGNFGLGGTPNAWDTNVYKALQVGTGVGSASLIGRTDSINAGGLAVNTYYSSTGYRYIGSSYATLYFQNNGQHHWYNAPSGTAGALISLNQAMTLDANGRLGVATTDPRAVVHIGASLGGGNVPSTSALMFGANNSIVTFLGANDSDSIDGVIGSWNTVYNHQNAKIEFFKSANTGQLRFYTQGGVGIIERARITSDGRLFVGTLSETGSNDSRAVFKTDDASGVYRCLALETPITTSRTVQTFRNGNGQVGDIALNGTATAYNTKGTAADGAQLNYQGITFPATQSASSDANTLDDYEEGSFNPTLNCTTNSGTIAYGYQYGYYVKVGQLVWYYFDLQINSYSGASGVPYITLPFVNANLSANYSSFVPWDVNQNFTGTNVQACGYIEVNGTSLYLFKRQGTSSEIGTVFNINTTGRISGVITYRAAS
jgi:hypothetical protein